MPFRILKWVVAFVVLIQLVPFGRQHDNPPVAQEPPWDSPRTRELAKRACYDCHSHETAWPWYSSVAPVSWLTQHDVNGGRSHLNFSEWNKPQRHEKDIVEQAESGEMPPWFYLPMHPAARLNASDKAELLAGFGKTFGPQQHPGK